MKWAAFFILSVLFMALARAQEPSQRGTRFAYSDGPNCFNSVLVETGFLPSLRFSSSTELKYYLSSSLCRPLQDQERRQKGDIGLVRAFYEGHATEYHAFVFLSETLASSKNGQARQAPYRIQSLDQMLTYYSVPEKRECRQNTPRDFQMCNQTTSYFRCTPFSQFLKTSSAIAPEILRGLQAFGAFEKEIEAEVMRNKTLSETSQRHFLQALENLSRFLQKGPSLDQKSLFLAKSLPSRLSSIENQLRISGHTRLVQDLKKFQSDEN